MKHEARQQDTSALREASNVVRRIIGAYRHPQADDPHRLDDEITGAEHWLAALPPSAPPGLDVERLARSLSSHSEPPDWGSDMHTQPLYDFGSIHDKRCIPTAQRIAAEYARLEQDHP